MSDISWAFFGFASSILLYLPSCCCCHSLVVIVVIQLFPHCCHPRRLFLLLSSNIHDPPCKQVFAMVVVGAWGSSPQSSCPIVVLLFPCHCCPCYLFLLLSSSYSPRSLSSCHDPPCKQVLATVVVGAWGSSPQSSRPVVIPLCPLVVSFPLPSHCVIVNS